MRYHTFILITWLLLGLSSCDPYQDDPITLGPLPGAPDFRIEAWADDPNFIIVEDMSTGFFARSWSFPGGIPSSSTKQLDTVFYRRAGTYDIVLDAASTNGNAQNRQTVTIANDAVSGCSDELELLAGGCEDDSFKCWTFSRVAAAVTVGPTPGSGEWFTSTSDGLQDEQYDDSFCFYFDGSGFLYMNNGLTVDPWDGFQPVPYDPPQDHTYILIPGAGENGELRIELTMGSFLGVWDASNVYDVVLLTEDELVVRTPFLDGGGWFELYFLAN